MRELQKHDYGLCKEGICTCLCRKCQHCMDPKKRTPRRGFAGRRDTMMREGRARTKGNGDSTK